ncbi:MAG: hypothetical protein JXR70_09875 [Spirochaetales bacterium]|nr:hypothetical protein [Spirochaetales bacterium]
MKWEHSISRLKLEQHVLGELPAKESRDIELKIGSDKSLAREYEDILASNKAILEAYPIESMVRAIEDRLDRERVIDKNSLAFGRIVKKSVPFVGALAVAAMGLFVIGPVYFSKAPVLNHDNQVVYAKGAESRLLLYLKEDGETRLVSDGEKLKQGDRLRMAYFSGEAPYGVLLSIDGRGAVTLHFPDNANQLPLITTGEESLLDFSYELDDAPFFEKFYFITSANSFNAGLVVSRAEDVLGKIKQGGLPGNLHLGKEFNEYSVLIQKEGQP